MLPVLFLFRDGVKPTMLITVIVMATEFMNAGNIIALPFLKSAMDVMWQVAELNVAVLFLAMIIVQGQPDFITAPAGQIVLVLILLPKIVPRLPVALLGIW